MGEEIRRRLEYAFSAEGTPTDESTDTVLAEMKEIARDLSRYGPWETDPLVFDVLKASVNALLLNRQPRGEPKPETRARFHAVYGDKLPADIGLILAQAAIFACGRERRGGLTGPTGLATGLTDSTSQVGQPTGSGLVGPTGPSGPGRARLGK
jgi:hypothetical protein